MPRVNVRFKDDNGNIVRLREYNEPGLGGIIIRLLCAGAALRLIVELFQELQRFLQSMSMM